MRVGSEMLRSFVWTETAIALYRMARLVLLVGLGLACCAAVPQ